MATLQKTTPSQTVSALSIFVVLVAAGVSYFWLLPVRQASQSARNQAAAQEAGLNTDVTNLNRASADLSTKESEMAGRAVDINKALAAMPPFEDVPGLYVQMERLLGMAKTMHLQDGTYTVGAPGASASGKIGKVPVTMTLTGSYADLKSYVALLESSLRPLVIEHVSFGLPAASPTGEKRTGYTLTLAGTFWSNDLSSAYAAPSPNQ